MAANTLILPGERTGKTGQREFDFDQLKIFLTNLGNTVITANSTINISQASVAAAYRQANNAYAQANTALLVAEEAYATANEALAQNATSGSVSINGNLLLPNADIDFVNGNTTEMNGYTPDGVQSIVFVEVNPNLNIASLTTSGNINVGQTIYMADGTDLYGAVNVANTAATLALLVAEEAYSDANSANSTAGLAYGFANTLVRSITAANTSNLIISGNSTNVIIDTALTAGGGGGGGGNYQVDVYANSASPIANAALNFNNTATVNVSVSANGTGTAANVAFSVNAASFAAAITDDVFVAANGQTVFNISSNVTATRYVFVYRNGVEQIPTTDYTSNGANVVVLTSPAYANESIEVRNFATAGNLTVSAGTTLIVQSNVALGAQPFYQQVYTYYTVPLVCAAGMAAKFVIQANNGGLYDVIVGGLANGNGTTWLSATDITSTTYNITSPWYYQSGDGSQNLYIGIKNRGGNPMSFNLAQLTLTRFN